MTPEREAELLEDVARLQAEVEAARELMQHQAEFQKWAQGYLNSARWAGHDRSDAVKTELLERDRELARLREALEKVTEYMDRAGGDGHGMPECPWCRAQGSQDGDEKWHCGNCELLLARAALASLSRPEGGQ